MAPRGMHDDLHAGAIVIEAGGREAALVGTTTGRSQGTATGTRTFSLVVQPTGPLRSTLAVYSGFAEVSLPGAMEGRNGPSHRT